jgi:hypothetical protein
MRPRRPWFLSGLLSAVLSSACLLGAGPDRASAEPLDSKEGNWLIDIPADWKREDARATWEKDSIVVGAKRVVTKLDDGKPAQGQGGQMHLSVTDAPAGKTLADIAADPAQRELLLRLYAKPPEVRSETTKIKDAAVVLETPAVRLIALGTALTDSGTELPCVGMLVMAVVKKKLYRLRLFAWVTPTDAEQLRLDLESIDMGFCFLDLTAEKPPKGERPKDAPPGEEPKPPPEEDAKPVGDSDEEKALDNVVQGWKAKKPKKLATEEINHGETPFRQVFLRGNDSLGSCDVTLDVYPNGMIDGGRKVPDQDLRKFMTTSFWQNIAASYPKGALETFQWPRVKGGQFLTLPLLEAPKVLYDADDPRPKVEDVDADMVMKKLHITEEVKNPSVGKCKCEQAYRGVVRGNRERVGPEVNLRFAWRTEGFSFFVYVTIRKEGAKRYLEPVRQFLESIEVSK